VILPRLGSDAQPNAHGTGPGDLIYFGRLRGIPPATIASGIKEAVRRGSLVDQYAEQIHVTAILAWEKYGQLKRAIHILVPAGAFAGLGLLSWLTMRLQG
jgi:hypothetical protein